MTEEECITCGTIRKYNPYFDAYYCTTCNKWLEGTCNDPGCTHHCKERPETPNSVR